MLLVRCVETALKCTKNEAGGSVSVLQEYSNYTFPVAVAIVLSGMYEDDQDNADDVVYTGQGGHNLTGDKRQIRDQVLERGNLALKVCRSFCPQYLFLFLSEMLALARSFISELFFLSFSLFVACGIFTLRLITVR